MTTPSLKPPASVRYGVQVHADNQVLCSSGMPATQLTCLDRCQAPCPVASFSTIPITNSATEMRPHRQVVNQ